MVVHTKNRNTTNYHRRGGVVKFPLVLVVGISITFLFCIRTIWKGRPTAQGELLPLLMIHSSMVVQVDNHRDKINRKEEVLERRSLTTTPTKRTTSSNDLHHKPIIPLPDWLPPDEWQEEECIPLEKWQLDDDEIETTIMPRRRPFLSTCNIFHELDVTSPGDLEFIACGGARCAFSLPVHDGTNSNKIVLKWTKNSTINDSNPKKPYRKAAMDTTAMERYQFSPYILNIYGNCGSSQMIEAASHGTLLDQMILAKLLADDQQRDDGLMNHAMTNLRISYHLAQAVADVHFGSSGLLDSDSSSPTHANNDAVPSFAHNDIDCEQFIFVNGIFQLNDFHYAGPIYQNRTSGLSCTEKGVSWSTKHTKLRAPEEFIHGKRKHKVHRDKVDVWMLGDVLYYTLTKQFVMEGKTNKETLELYQQKQHSPIPAWLLESTNPAHQAMIKALKMAWTFDPEKRPSATEIANVLRNALVELHGGNDSEAPWPVQVRELPQGWYQFDIDDPPNKPPSFIGYTDNYRDYPDDD